MELFYNGSEKHIENAVNKANDILRNPLFYEEIEKLHRFDNTKLTPKQIAEIMEDSNQQILIKTYWYMNPFKPRTCVNATTVNANLIKLNTRCFSSDLKTAVNTLIHECTHAADILDNHWDFTHVDNDNSGEENNTAPWAIGALAEKFV